VILGLKYPVNAYDNLNSILLDESAPKDKTEALSFCKKIWFNNGSKKRNKKSRGMKNLHGKVSMIRNRAFCFINTRDGISAICYKSDLKFDLYEGDSVIFDVTPSYDAKKKKDSWKAIEVRKQQG
jgi:hypothetical protein